MKFTKSMILPLLIFCFLTMLTIQSQAQSTRILYCNEKKSVSDVKSFPRQAIVTRTNRGSIRYLEWNAFIGNDPGTYKMTISSKDDFAFQVFEKEGNPGKDWFELRRGTKAFTKGTGYNKSFYFEYTFSSRGIYSEGSEILIRVVPTVSNTNVGISWYTTGCRSSPPPKNDPNCRLSPGLYGLGDECYCNGVKSDLKRCSP